MAFQKNSGIKLLLAALIVLLVVLGYVCYHGYRHSIQPRAEMTMTGITVFSSTNPVFNFSFEYKDAEWKPRESRGRRQKYDSLYLQGPIDRTHEFATLIAITVKPLEATGGAPELLTAYLKMSSNLTKFKVLNKETLSIGGEKAFSSIFEQEMLLPRGKVDAKPVQVLQGTFFLVRSGESYEFTLISTKDQWKECLPAFEHLLKTFRFKG